MKMCPSTEGLRISYDYSGYLMDVLSFGRYNDGALQMMRVFDGYGKGFVLLWYSINLFYRQIIR